ncbi:SDR family NAD(P)-dependent oxidoreductase [Streptomyces litchfieldiae]|uniref:SDR family NAD(P)-dependent oxidoreductase n=1 Tax=Streptomyces litchfieldiae TaxID=3075543 RepID=A0ABU2N0G6_9ACTN|nr:SDR family NAD(P)-dependent oxidoreductase [Streptomyces sp. DSM 44938]MDT0346814.1 SDR family NAD(P)-dependent oxidoreductase [Streptomyces sp. DSM 44938]
MTDDRTIQAPARRFTGKVAVVTGGGSGIGAACARRLAAEGAAVVIADIAAEAGEQVAEALRADGHQAAHIPCDVALAADWQRLADTVRATHGRVDVVVSNAYAMAIAPTHELAEPDWHRVLDVILKAAYLAVRHLHGLLPAAGGSLVAVSSVHALRGRAGFAPYAAAKGGLEALVRQLAVEYGPALRVNAVTPGPIATPQWRFTSEPDLRAEAERTVLGRFGTPEEVAAAVAFLASGEAAFITGATLPIDGGMTIRL